MKKIKRKRLFLCLTMVLLLLGWVPSALAQNVITIGHVSQRQGPIQPKAGGFTIFPKVTLPKGAPPWSRAIGCRATSFNGLSAPVDSGGNYAIFNIPLLGGPLFSNITCRFAVIDSIKVFPGTLRFNRYLSLAQLRVEGKTKDGKTLVLTPASEGTTYVSSNSKAITVTAEGVVQAVGAGNATITVTQGKFKAQVSVTSTVAAPISIFARPAPLRFKKAGENQKIQVFQVTSFGLTQEVTSGFTLSSDNTQVVRINGSSVVAVGSGRALVTASFGGKTDQILAVVEGKVRLLSLSAAPTTLSFKNKGDTAQLKVTGNYSDKSTLDLTKGAAGTRYVSSAPRVVTVSADGLVEALSSGSATITISNSALSGKTITVSVSAQIPTIRRLTAQPATVLIRQLKGTQQLKITGDFSDNSQKDLTKNKFTTYVSSDTKVVTVSKTGLLTAVAFGKADITVRFESQQVKVPVQVAKNVLLSIAFAKKSHAIVQNAIDLKASTVQLKVTGSYDDKTTGDLTAKSTGTTYKSSNTSVGTISADGKFFAGTRAGTARITATNKGKTATVDITVTRYTSQRQALFALPGKAEDVAVVGTTAFVAAGSRGIHIVDVKDPAKPKLLRTLALGTFAQSVQSMGNMLLVGDSQGGLHIVPATRVAYTDSMVSIPATGGGAHNGAFWQNRLFIAGGKAGVITVNIDNITKPTVLGASKKGDVLWVAADSRWVTAVEVNKVSFYDRNVSSWWSKSPARVIALTGVRRVIASGSTTAGTFYAGAADGVYRINAQGARVRVTTPSTLVGRALAREHGWLHAAGKFFNRNDLGMFLMDNPLQAVYRGNFPFVVFGFSLQTEGMAASRGYIYMAVGTSGLQIGRYRQWLDYEKVAPKVSLVYPNDNSTQTEDKDLHIEINATDDREVDKVEIRLNNKLLTTLTTRPFRWSQPSPNVSSKTSVLLEATAIDMNGLKKSSTSRTVHITPITDTKAPTVRIVQPANGAEVEIGKSLVVKCDAQDDKRVAEARLFVNGKQVQTLFYPPYIFDYPIAPNTADETKLAVYTEVLDYGGNKAKSPTVNLVAVKLTELATDLSSTNKSFENKRVLIRGKTIKIDGKHTFKSLWIDNGGTLTHSATTTSTVNAMDLTADYIQLSADSKIDVTNKGYLGVYTGGNSAIGRTRGNSTTNGARFGQGGGHGGPGGYAASRKTPSPAYDSLFSPRFPGGGGGQSCSNSSPCNGGGVIRLTSKVFVLDGQILANGGSPTLSSGGAGGTVYIKTGALSGSGEIQANGGGRPNQASAPGAGGRVALYYDTLGGFSLDKISARGTGGAKGGIRESAYYAGGAGTIFVKSKLQTYGTLIIDNKSPTHTVQLNPLPQVGKGKWTGVTRNTLTNTSASWQTDDLVGLWVTPNLKQPTKVYQITTNTQTTLTLSVGSDNLTSITKVGENYRGLLRLDGLFVRGRAQVSTQDRLEIGLKGKPGLEFKAGGLLEAGELVIEPKTNLTMDGATLRTASPITLAALTMKNNSVLTTFFPSITETFSVELKITGALNIDATSKIDVSQLGYLSGYRFGNGSIGRTKGNVTTGGARSYQGGAHGGVAGYAKGISPPPQPYGSLYFPKLPGGGAGLCGSTRNCNGGGVVRITSGSLTLNGKILANGGPEASTASSSVGGAGGSIWIETGNINGSGQIAANGGGSHNASTGAGSGGRIAVYYDTMGTFKQDKITAYGVGGAPGGRRYSEYFSGATGTVFLKSKIQAYGTLLADHNNPTRSVQTTRLPQVGKSTSTGISAKVLTDSKANWPPGELVGHSVNPNTGQTKTYKILANTKTTLTLDMGSDDLTKIAAVGNTYHGVLFLDKAIVRNGAIVKTDDQVKITGGGTLSLADGKADFGGLGLDPNTNLFLDGGHLMARSPISLKSLTLVNNAVLSVPAATSAGYTPLQIKVAGTLSIDSTSRIDVSGKGYSGGHKQVSGIGMQHNQDITFGSKVGAGGSHGGKGGSYHQTGSSAGPTFGRFIGPVEAGGGGGCGLGSTCQAGNGGGFVKIEANKLELDGVIQADGGRGKSGGSGAGGGIYIKVQTLSGRGHITANGGSSLPGSIQGASGGGGRIALHYQSAQGFDPYKQVTAYPGLRINSRNTPPGAGTIFLKPGNQTFGTLLIRQNNLPTLGFPTQLLSVGEGVISSLQKNQLVDNKAHFAANNQLAGLWLKPDTSKNKLFKLVAGSKNLLITRAQDGSLLTATSQGKRYQGILRLDKLILTGGAKVRIADEAMITQIQLDKKSIFISKNLHLPACPTSCIDDLDCQAAGCKGKSYCSGGACR